MKNYFYLLFISTLYSHNLSGNEIITYTHKDSMFYPASSSIQTDVKKSFLTKKQKYLSNYLQK